jgi:hypothetical protein
MPILSKRLWGAALVALALALPARAAEADRFLPGDAEQVIVVNVKQILESPLVKKYALPEIEKQLKENKDLKQLQTLTGLDPLKDIHSVVIANSGSTGEKALLIVRGKFDVEKIHTVVQAVAADKGDVKISKLGDRNLYESKQQGRPSYFTFFDGTTMIGSPSKELVATAIEGKGGKVNKDLAAALQAADAKQSIYAVGLITEDLRKQAAKVAQGPAESLLKIKSVSGGLNVTKDLAGSLQVSTGDPRAAKELSDLAQVGKGLLAVAANSNKEFGPLADELLETLKIDTAQGDVKISFKVTEKTVEKALQAVPKPDKE